MAPAQPLAPPLELHAGPIGAAEEPPWGGTAYRLLYVDAGRVRISLDSAAFEAHAGELVAAEPGACRVVRFDSARGWALAFTAAALHPPAGADPHHAPLAGDSRWLAFLRGRGRPRGPLAVPRDARPSLRWLASRLESELTQRPPGHAEAARALLNLVLVRVTRLIAHDADLSVTLDPAAVEILAVIDARFTEQLSLDQLAAAVGRSPRQVSRIAHDQTGVSPIGLIERRRMEEARRRLLETAEPVNRIAQAVGYPDPGYFRRRFRRAFGVSPGSWRADPRAG